jgi:hypothetical protein
VGIGVGYGLGPNAKAELRKAFGPPSPKYLIKINADRAESSKDKMAAAYQGWARRQMEADPKIL